MTICFDNSFPGLHRDAVDRGAQRGVELSLEVDESLDAFCHRDALVAMVGNLARNAVAYTGDGGHVTVRAAAGEEGVLIEVQDDGIGIAPHHLERIFERFEGLLVDALVCFVVTHLLRFRAPAGVRAGTGSSDCPRDFPRPDVSRDCLRCQRRQKCNHINLTSAIEASIPQLQLRGAYQRHVIPGFLQSVAFSESANETPHLDDVNHTHRFRPPL